MKPIAAIILCAALACVTACDSPITVGVTAGSCARDSEIPADRRKPAEDAALLFARTMLGPHPEEAYARMSIEAHGVTTPAQLTAIAKQIQANGPYDNLRLAHVYRVQTTGSTTAPAVCSTASRADTVFLAARQGEQMHVFLTAKTRNNDWAFSMWLTPEGGGWRVHAFYMSPEKMSGRTAADLMALARTQRDARHMFNASMLYAGARYLLDRGPNVQLGMLQELDTQMRGFETAPALKSPPPFKWRLDGVDYSIARVTIVGVDGKLALVFASINSGWNGTDDDDAERRNKRLLESIMKAYPELTGTFGVLVAQILAPDGNRGWGTVYETGKGFLPRKTD